MASTIETEQATRTVVQQLPAAFMLAMDTYSRGGELGFMGMDFYTCGRGGALGEVDADVVAAGFVFFNPALVREQWEPVLQRWTGAPPPRPSSRSGAWAAEHLADGVDYDRLNDLLGRVVAGADPGAAPLFAAWRAMPEPSDAKALTLHRLNVLRELRGGLHGACVVAAGLVPASRAAERPDDGGHLRLARAPADIEDDRAAWDAAEEATRAAVAATFAVLDDAERDELIALSRAARG
ncbi:MAG: hypothetical protein R2690_10955 [Acidimicrobiales bacterium]